MQKQLQEAIGREGDVLVLTKAEAVARERNFWWTSTPIGFAFGAYAYLTKISAMPLVLTPGRAGLVFALTMTMCVLSGFFALSKVKSVDPADVF